MLEAMMNDLGLSGRPEAPREEPDTDDEVVQEALQEHKLAEEEAEQDIQELLHEPMEPRLTQQKPSTSRRRDILIYCKTYIYII